MNILITGGAGFVGSSLALHFKSKFPSGRVVAFDNLKRRGSELNLSKFKEAGIEFVHGDIRNPSDFEAVKGSWDVFFECSAEPSVLAGINSSPKYLLETNLVGTINCLEFARQNCGLFVFLSTSRVYSIAPLRELNLVQDSTRLVLAPHQSIPGVGEKGISEKFPTDSSRSLYGTSKLASEYLVQEYTANYGLKSVINRCGVIAGPGQFGKVDQGVFTLWVARHFFNQPLKYTGFGGTGKQVRDLIHIQDLISLLEKQIHSKSVFDAQTFNVGGGTRSSVSLLELTSICREVTGNAVAIESEKKSSAVDIPWYVSDISKAQASFDWQPERTVVQLVTDIKDWLFNNRDLLKQSFC
jgi:CDP-paratose 2-epimerase